MEVGGGGESSCRAASIITFLECTAIKERRARMCVHVRALHSGQRVRRKGGDEGKGWAEGRVGCRVGGFQSAVIKCLQPL